MSNRLAFRTPAVLPDCSPHLVLSFRFDCFFLTTLRPRLLVLIALIWLSVRELRLYYLTPSQSIAGYKQLSS